MTSGKSTYRRKMFKFDELRAIDPALAERVEATMLGSLAASVEPISLEDLETARLLISGELTLGTNDGRLRGSKSQAARAAFGRVVRKYLNENDKPRRALLAYITTLQATVSAPSQIVPETPDQGVANSDEPQWSIEQHAVICPECGRGFKSGQAVGVHRTRTHGNSKHHKKSRDGRKPSRKETHAKAS